MRGQSVEDCVCNITFNAMLHYFFLACLSLPEERLEVMFSVCWYIQSWCLWPGHTKRYKSKDSILWKVCQHLVFFLLGPYISVVLLKCLWVFFINLKLKLLTQFPAGNYWKIILFMKNIHLQYWIIGLTKHLPAFILSNLLIFLLVFAMLETVLNCLFLFFISNSHLQNWIFSLIEQLSKTIFLISVVFNLVRNLLETVYIWFRQHKR